MVSKADTLEKFKEDRRLTEIGLSDQYDLAELNHSFYSGDRMAYRVGVQDATVGSRRIVVFNRVKPFVNAITGFAIKLRRKPSYNARQDAVETQREFTDHTNSLSDYVRSNANMDQNETRQDKEMFICGYGAVDTVISHLMNPFGEVKMENIAYFDVGWDPNARGTNLLDARWAYRKKKMNRKDATTLFKGSDPDDFEDADSGVNRDAGKTSLRIDNTVQEEDMVQVYNYQWWEFEKYYRIDNPIFDNRLADQTKLLFLQMMSDLKEDNIELMEDDVEGAVINAEIAEDLFEFDPEAEIIIANQKIRNALKTLFNEFGLGIEETQHRRKVYFTAIVSGETVFHVFKSQDQSGFTIKFKTGDFDEFNKIWQGIVDQLREPSKYSNKALTEILYTIASNSKGGVMYEESAVDDPERFEEQYASTIAAIRVNDGALSGGTIQPKAEAALPTGYENVLEIAKKAMFETTGVNPEFLGSSENKQVSALLEAQRIEQVTSTLANYFDSILLFQKENGQLIFTYMRILSENNPQMMFSVIGEDNTISYRRVDPDALTSEYEIDVQEAPTSPAQKDQNLTVLMKYAQEVALLGINVYPTLVDELPISQRKKQELIQAMSPKQPSPEEVAQKQLMDKITMDGILAKTKNLEADTQNKLSQIPVNRSKAEQTVADATLKKSQIPGNILDAEQTELENQLLRSGKTDLFNVNI